MSLRSWKRCLFCLKTHLGCWISMLWNPLAFGAENESKIDEITFDENQWNSVYSESWKLFVWVGLTIVDKRLDAYSSCISSIEEYEVDALTSWFSSMKSYEAKSKVSKGNNSIYFRSSRTHLYFMREKTGMTIGKTMEANLALTDKRSYKLPLVQ